MAPTPSIINKEPPITCRYVAWLLPCSSPKTKIPQSNPQSWLVLESGMPRPMPTYFAAYCWNRSPITQMNPPSMSQKITVRAG